MTTPTGRTPEVPSPVPAVPTNGFAITALVSSLVLAPLGVVFGHIALRQIRRTGEQGRGLAIGGLVIGYIGSAVAVITCIVLVMSLTTALRTLDSSVHSNSAAGPIPGDTNSRLSRNEIKALIADAIRPTDVTDKMSNVSDAAILNAYGDMYESERQSVYDMLVKNDNLSPEAKAVLSVPAGDKAKYNDQDVLNAVAIGEADASIQVDSLEGQVLLYIPYGRDVGGFKDAEALIFQNKDQSAKRPVFSASQALGNSMPHPSGEFDGVVLPSIKFKDVRIIKEQVLPNRSGTVQAFAEYGLYGLQHGNKQDQWQQIRRWSIDDSSVEQAIRNLLSRNVQHR